MNWQPIETAPKDGTHILVGWYADEEELKWVATCAFFVPQDSPLNPGDLLTCPGKYRIGEQVSH